MRKAERLHINAVPPLHKPSAICSRSYSVETIEIDRKLIATQRVMPLGGSIRRLQPLEIARLLVVVEYDLLIKVCEFC